MKRGLKGDTYLATPNLVELDLGAVNEKAKKVSNLSNGEMS